MGEVVKEDDRRKPSSIALAIARRDSTCFEEDRLAVSNSAQLEFIMASKKQESRYRSFLVASEAMFDSWRDELKTRHIKSSPKHI